MDNHGGKIRVEHRRAERVLETADEDRLIDERIQRPAKSAPLRSKSGPARSGRPRDDQDLEIRSMCIRAPEGWRQHIRRYSLAVLVRLPIAGVLAEGPREQGAGDAAGKRRSRVRVVRRGMVAQCRHQLKAGIGVEFLGRGHLGERSLELGPVARALRPSLGQFHQIPPLVAPRSGTGKKLIDPNWMATWPALGHLTFLLRWIVPFVIY